MSFLAMLLRAFDDAIEWPDDVFLDDNDHVDDWTHVDDWPASPSGHALSRSLA